MKKNMGLFKYSSSNPALSMKIIRVATTRGIELKGAFFGREDSSSVLIIITGLCSNVFQNDLLPTTGDILAENDIACIIGHCSDAFSFIALSDLVAKKQKFTGTVEADFSYVYEDVDAYVQYAKKLGFKHIILGGHSLGSNKIIHYLATTTEKCIEYFIVSSPIDLKHWWDIIPDQEKYRSLAQKAVDDGRGDEVMPYIFSGFTPMRAKTVLALYNASHLKNTPVLTGDGEVDSLAAIDLKGAFIIGGIDKVVGDNPKEFITKINACCKHAAENKVITIEGASHVFYGRHDDYAAIILDCLLNHHGLKP